MERIQLLQNYHDSASTSFAAQITTIGLKKLRYLLDQNGYSSQEVIFIGAPDFSVPLNNERIKAGFCIGGVLKWGDGNVPIVPLDIMPNCCGAMCAEIKNVAIEEVLNKIESLRHERHTINGIQLEWDVNRRNHFLNIYTDQVGKSYAILHCSLPEVKSDNALGAGVYHSSSKILTEKVQTCHTPYGPIKYLIGDEALQFNERMSSYNAISRAKRNYIIEYLFGDYRLISNQGHLTLYDVNTALLGCYISADDQTLFPITVGPNEEAFLARANKPYSIKKGPAYYIVPHGTGNKIKAYDAIQYDEEHGVFIASRGSTRYYVSDIGLLTEGYNPASVVTSPDFSHLFLIENTLSPLYEMKI